MTKVERFQAAAEDGEEFTVLKSKRPPRRTVNGGLVDLEEYDFTLADGRPLRRMSAEGVYMMPPPDSRIIKRVGPVG